MKPFPAGTVRRGPLVAAVILTGWIVPVSATAQVPPRGPQSIPTAAFEAALTTLSTGDFASALDIAGRDYGSGIRIGNQRWIDSIASSTAVGEAHYELGALADAVQAYDEALGIAAANAEWLLAVQFPQQGPQASARPREAPWGRSARGTRPATFPDTVTIRFGGGDPEQVLKRGGVLASPVNIPVRPHEIMRALVIALYRRGAILGPLGQSGSAIDEINTALAQRPAPPGHWSQAWIDVAIGTAAWSQGRLDQAAAAVERGATLAGKLDHPLTAWALIVAGRIALERADPVSAARLFEEATYAAVDFADTRALEEAFRWAAAAHQAAGTPGVPATLQGGAAWAQGSMPVLRTTLLAAAAEVLAAGGDAKGAAARLGEIDPRVLRGGAGRGQCGAAAAHATALALYAGGDAAGGDRELLQALAIQRGRSPRLFQAARLAESIAAGTTKLSERQADQLFTTILADPSARDFAAEPLDCLAALGTPRAEAFETWEAVAGRCGTELWLAAVEASKRARWLVLAGDGGRRVALDRLLSADPDGLPRDVAATRTAILKRHPPLDRLLEEEARVRARLSASLLAAAADGAGRGAAGGEGAPWEELAALAARRAALVDLVAAGREEVAVDFPPLVPVAEIRRRLAPGEAILSFRWSPAGLRAVLETGEKAVAWTVPQPDALLRELAMLARGLCLFDPRAPVTVDRFASSEWRSRAAVVERMLFQGAKVRLGDGITDLAIVPDGALWYLPFEILPAGSVAEPEDDAGDAPAAPLLRDVCRVRYAPTRSLAVAGLPETPAGPPAARGPVGIHAGQAPRGERPEVFADAARRLAEGLERPIPLAPSPVARSAPAPLLAAALCEGIVILDEVDLAGDAPLGVRALFGRAGDRSGRPSATFADWLAAPRKRPSRVVFAGMQTPMADGLAGPVARPGEELFLASTDLLAAGARSAILSRWRVGGRSSADLIAEFLRDADEPGVSPAESWARAVDVVTPEEPDMSAEGRLRPAGKDVLADLRHPFFWAGYLLVDGGTARVPREADAPRAPGAKRPAVGKAK